MADTAAIVLLAAGASRRFGSAKQLLPLAGRPLVRLQAEKALASRAERVVVVTGGFVREVAAALAGLPVLLAHNAAFTEGQSTSVRCGLAAAGDAAAVLFLPVDMPFLRVTTLDLLFATWSAAGSPEARPAAVVPLYGGRRGAPVLFDRRLFPELRQLEGDQGGRVLLPRHASELAEVAIADPREGRDLDRPEDLDQELLSSINS